MAQNMTTILAEAAAWQDLAGEWMTLISKTQLQARHDNDRAIDWTNNSGGLITEEGNGNITGMGFARADVSNIKSSLDWVLKFFDDQSLASIPQANHFGIVNKLAKPEA